MTAGSGSAGRVSVVGIGPGRADWCTPDVTDRISNATDLVGYHTYLGLVGVATEARRHGSDNRVEAERAVLALDLAAGGGDVVVVSSGDPGVFAMASAVLEQLDDRPDRWLDVVVEVLPGVSAAQALASRVGAPLGHDFCTISLSDVLKPWSVVERRLDAAAGADFVLALYNPTSRHRPWQFGRALEVVAGHRGPDTPVVIGRDIGRPDEHIEVRTLATCAGADIDMRTAVIIGSSTTRVLAGRPLACRVYTPRWYGDDAATSDDQPRAGVIDIGHDRHRRLGRPTDHDHGEVEPTGGDQLRRRRRAAGVLGHDGVDAVLAQQGQFVLERERATRQDQFVVRGQHVGDLDRPHHHLGIERRERVDAPAPRGHQRARRPQRHQCLGRRGEVVDLDPPVAGDRLPGRAEQPARGCAGGRRRGGDVVGHDRCERVRRVDDRVDGSVAQVGDQAVGPAEAAATNPAGTRHRRRGDPRQRREHVHPVVADQDGRQLRGFRRAGQHEHARHGDHRRDEGR